MSTDFHRFSQIIILSICANSCNLPPVSSLVSSLSDETRSVVDRTIWDLNTASPRQSQGIVRLLRGIVLEIWSL